MDEIYRLASERWAELRISESRYRPPSDVLFPCRSGPTTAMDRAIALLERIVTRLKRARRPPLPSR
jgi:hypothetical protein